MKHNKTIQFKAAFLVLVFSLNTALGFACSMGFDMGYNKHHHEEKQVDISIKKNNHDAETSDAALVQQHNDHDSKASQHPCNQQSEEKTDDCCSNGVTSFNLLNKTVPQSISFVHPAFATAFISTFHQAILLPQHDIFKNIRAFAQSYHPPIPDICIAVQRFLI